MAEATRPALVHVVGHSNDGKTTLIERLIPRLRARGFRVGTVKHAHNGFELDHPGKDSWRHAKAGAEAVAIIAPERTAWLVQTPQESSAEQAMERFAGLVDLVLVEGFKDGGTGPRIVLGVRRDGDVAITEARCEVGGPVNALSDEAMASIVDFCANATTAGVP